MFIHGASALISAKEGTRLGIPPLFILLGSGYSQRNTEKGSFYSLGTLMSCKLSDFHDFFSILVWGQAPDLYLHKLKLTRLVLIPYVSPELLPR